MAMLGASKILPDWIRKSEHGATALEGPPRWDPPLSLGREVYLSSKEGVTNLSVDQAITIQPGDFALMLTAEWLQLPGTVMGFISLKFKYKALGLINVSGFHVDPHYKGHLIFAVYNAGPNPVTLRGGDKPFMIIFAEVGSGENQERPPDGANYRMIPSHMMTALQGPPVSLTKLHKELEETKQKVTILVSVVTGLVLAVIGAGIALLIR